VIGALVVAVPVRGQGNGDCRAKCSTDFAGERERGGVAVAVRINEEQKNRPCYAA